ncbi:MAG TPA: YMGG-like glycine zipper-containing protein [Pyrinomonadaceae bacterium]|nr:YMGG-like glycine zipper-containing protein [Pyrinomonadaceae bacterium]
MNRVRRIFSLSVMLLLTLASVGMEAQAQRRGTRSRDRQVRELVRRIEMRTDTFRSSIDNALDRSTIDNTRREDNINQLVTDFESVVDQLNGRVQNRQASAADVQLVLDRASPIDRLVRRNRVGARAETEWASLRQDLNQLASLYTLTWRGNRRNNTDDDWQNNNTQNNYPQNNYPSGNTALNRLTGTYRLDATRSDDARQIAEREVRSLSYGDRQRVLDQLTARLESPTGLAIDRRGRNVTIASTRSQQFTFEADGIERTETGPGGRTVRVRSTLEGDRLVVTSSGDSNSDFSVTFDPVENGQRLRVVRRISDINLSRPVEVVSLYEKTSEVAQLDLYNGGPGYTGSDSTTGTASGQFIVPDGTQIIAALDNNLSTRAARENDPFTMTVRSPYQYEGATIRGHLTNVNRSGRITGRSEVTLNFDTITLRNGQSYRFAGITESVRTTSGETVRVDNEGAVREDNRTTTTAKRAGIGTAVGAIIGAIAGGGKGAAIGAVIGAGAGAGSVYVQGKDDLELVSGTELTLRASAPR